MFKFLSKVPYWYLIAIPLLLTFMGAASNQAVLIANGDKFPVMASEEKLQKYCQPQEASDSLSAVIAKALAGRSAIVKETAPDPYTCSNGGEFLDEVHVIMTPKSHLRPLADIFDMHDGIYSIGDFSLMLGEWIMGWAPLAWIVLVIRKFIEG